MTEAQQTVWVLASFGSALIIIYVFAAIVGPERKALWFKRREKMNFFTRRGMLGEAWNFGVPRCWQGYAIGISMYGTIALASYLLTFLIR